MTTIGKLYLPRGETCSTIQRLRQYKANIEAKYNDCSVTLKTSIFHKMQNNIANNGINCMIILLLKQSNLLCTIMHNHLYIF